MESVIQSAQLSTRDFDQFRLLAHRQCGLDLPDGKQQLVATRLSKKMRELKIGSFQAYYRHVVEDRTGEALKAMIDALTTNHTSFFREPAHFDFLKRHLVAGLRLRPSIRVWSAACSSGEEPYSIAFTLFDELGSELFPRVQILATDISTRVLDIARSAVYPSGRFAGIPPEQLRRYLLRGEGEHRDHFLVKRIFRQSVEFRRLNLMEDFSPDCLFPLIFCRNVMIYFNRSTQQDLVNRLTRCLEPGGYLLIGHAESLRGIEGSLEYIQPAVYRKNQSISLKPGRAGAER